MDKIWVETSPGLTDAEVDEINAKAAFASSDLFHDPALSLSYYDMWRRQAVARLVEDIPQEYGSYGITDANRAKVAWLLDFHPEHSSQL